MTDREKVCVWEEMASTMKLRVYATPILLRSCHRDPAVAGLQLQRV